jgi:hypothetical protein
MKPLVRENFELHTYEGVFSVIGQRFDSAHVHQRPY